MNFGENGIFVLIAALIVLHFGLALFGSLKINNILAELSSLQRICWNLSIWLLPIIGIVCLNLKYKLPTINSGSSGDFGNTGDSGGCGDGGC